MAREWARVLKPGGRLVLDLANRRALLGLVRRQPRIRYGTAQWEAAESFRWDARSECLANRTRWRWSGGQEEGAYRVRLYTPAQIRALLARAGLRVEAMLGSFRGTPFDPARSDRMLIVARRDGGAGVHFLAKPCQSYDDRRQIFLRLSKNRILFAGRRR